MVARPLCLAALAAAGCAGPGASRRLPLPAGEGRVVSSPPGPGSPAVDRAIDVASALVGHREIVVGGHDYGDDCAALVRAAFDRAGSPLPAGARDAESIYHFAYRRGLVRTGIRPRPGDLVFLADRPLGPPVHVGLVARVEPDGTALVLHRLARGVMRLRVNMGYPGRIADPATGKRLNDMLFAGAAAVPAGSLVVALAAFL